MSWRGRHRSDSNQSPLIKAAECMGASTWITSGAGGGGPDTVIGHHSRNHMVEWKVPGASRRQNQKDFHANWKGAPILTIRTEAELITLLTVQRNKGEIDYAIERCFTRLNIRESHHGQEREIVMRILREFASRSTVQA